MPGPLVPITVNGNINISFTAFNPVNTVSYTITGVQGGPITATVTVNCPSSSYPIVCSAPAVPVVYDTLQCEPIIVTGTVIGTCPGASVGDMTTTFEERIDESVITCSGNKIYTCIKTGGCTSTPTGDMCPNCPPGGTVPGIPGGLPLTTGLDLQVLVKNPAWDPSAFPPVISAILAPKIPTGSTFKFCPNDANFFEQNAKPNEWLIQDDPDEPCCIECETVSVIIYNWLTFVDNMPGNAPIPQMFYTECPNVPPSQTLTTEYCYRKKVTYSFPSQTAFNVPGVNGAIYLGLARNLCVVKGSVTFVGLDPTDTSVCSVTYTPSTTCPS